MTDDQEYLTRIELTHTEQVERFGWCMCDSDGHVSEGCPNE
jgi:hypothetical protein